jgi:hypothetical protein
MCLWNDFMAAAPGHPYLAKVIETVVNQVRNRFTSVDVDAKFCPNPETSVLKTSILHAANTLFTTGPCLLGASINRVLQRDLQTQFNAGDVQMPSREVDGSNEEFVNIPGRTVILHQNKKEMGATRFLIKNLNLIVAGTDMHKSQDSNGSAARQRDKKQLKQNLYGLENLYRDQEQANEDILIKVIG